MREARSEGLAWDQRDQGACAGSEGSEGSEGITRGRGERRGARGGGRCVDLAPRLPFLEVLIDLPCFQS